MLTALLTGFFLGLSLIVAIGAQNAFVLRQGILRQHVFYVALFCSIADSLLICLGVLGISYFFSNFISEFSRFIFGISSLWLFGYGLLRILSAFKDDLVLSKDDSSSNSLTKVISIIAVFTFLNPHVYLDTMVLIGSVSQQFIGNNKVYFVIGACLSSFVWFFGIAYGAKFLDPIMAKKSSWKIFDFLIALVMFIIAINLLYAGNWI